MLKRYTALLLLLGLLPLHLVAQDWTGAMDSNWNNPANWTDWPLNGENVTIDPLNYGGAQASPIISSNSVFTPDRLFVQNGAQVEIGANLTVSDRLIASDNAEIVQNGGVLTTGRLVMELGAGYHLMDGTLNTLNVLALGDDDVQPSRFVQDGGVVLASGEFGFDCAAGASSPLVQLNNGAFTLTGTAAWLGVAPATGRGSLIVNGATVAMTGGFSNSVGSTIDLYVEVNSGQLSVTASSFDLAHATDSVLQNGGTIRLIDLVVQNDGVWHTTDGQVQVLDQSELRGIGTYLFNDVSILPAAILRHTAPNTITVMGDWLNSGTLNPEQKTVIFAGSTAQSVDASTFFGLHVDNSGEGISLNGNSSVAGAFTLENGLVHTTSTDLLIVLDNGTSTSGSDNSHVDGPMRKVGNDAFAFPIGKNGQWRRIEISGINDQDTEYTAEFIDEAYTNTSSVSFPLISVSTTEHWTLTRAVTTDDARVELFWEDASASNLTDCSNLVAAAWVGNAWTAIPTTTTGSCTGNAAGSAASDVAATSFIAFTFGTIDGTIGQIEIDRIEELLPFPQPCDTWTLIPTRTQASSVQVIDHTGRRVAVDAIRTEAGYRIPTAHLPAGMYTVLLSTKDRSSAGARLVVVH